MYSLSISRRFESTAPSVLALLLTGCALVGPCRADINLADQPFLFSTPLVPGNLLLTPSVEWPTASTPAYLSTTAYAVATAYVGYFDPAKCYRYVYNSTTPSSSYFTPNSTTTTHTCTTTSSVPLWSGN